MDDASLLRTEKFNEMNFHLSKFKMQMVLEEKYIRNVVSGSEVEPINEGERNAARIQRFMQRERKAFAMIYLSLRHEQLSLVCSAKTAKEVWGTLKNPIR